MTNRLGKMMLVLLVAMVTMCTIVAEESVYNISSIWFEKYETLGASPGTMRHMEIDLLSEDGDLMYGALTELKVTRGGPVSTSNFSVVADGFTDIAGFKQISSSHVVVVDRGDSCVKLVSRETKKVSTLAGVCGETGFEDGIPGKFSAPWELLVPESSPNTLLISDTSNAAIRKVDLETGEVTTVLNNLRYPRGMRFYGEKLLVTAYHKIVAVNFTSPDFSSAVWSTLTGHSNKGTGDGDFSVAMFRWPLSIEHLSGDLFLMSGQATNKLRLLNIAQRQVQPVCVRTDSCNSSSTVYNPRGIFRAPDAVYIGLGGRIDKLSGGSAFDFDPTPPCSNTSVDVVLDDNEGYILNGEGVYSVVNPEADCFKVVNIGHAPCMDRKISVNLTTGESTAFVELLPGKFIELGQGEYKFVEADRGGCTATITVG